MYSSENRKKITSYTHPIRIRDLSLHPLWNEKSFQFLSISGNEVYLHCIKCVDISVYILYFNVAYCNSNRMMYNNFVPLPKTAYDQRRYITNYICINVSTAYHAHSNTNLTFGFGYSLKSNLIFNFPRWDYFWLVDWKRWKEKKRRSRAQEEIWNGNTKCDSYYLILKNVFFFFEWWFVAVAHIQRFNTCCLHYHILAWYILVHS